MGRTTSLRRDAPPVWVVTHHQVASRTISLHRDVLPVGGSRGQSGGRVSFCAPPPPPGSVSSHYPLRRLDLLGAATRFSLGAALSIDSCRWSTYVQRVQELEANLPHW
jgi:hypothetical protein